MHNRFAWFCSVVIGVFTLGCGSSGTDSGSSAHGGGSSASGGSGSSGSPAVADGGSGAASGGSGGSESNSTAGAGTSSIAGSSSMAGASSTSDATPLTGTLGDLGAIKPIISSLVILNSGERLVYMSTAPITCDTLSVSRWLGSTPADAQVVEIVVKTSMTTGTFQVGKGAEVNYAKGGRSSSYEQNAASGSVTFTINDQMGVAEGTVTATYASPIGDVSGSFHAEFCPGGQGY